MLIIVVIIIYNGSIPKIRIIMQYPNDKIIIIAIISNIQLA